MKQLQEKLVGTIDLGDHTVIWLTAEGRPAAPDRYGRRHRRAPAE